MDLNQVLLIPLVWKGGCKKVWKKLDFSPSPKFFIVYTSVLNPFQYKVAILKDKDFKTNTTQDFHRKVKIMIFKTAPKIPEVKLDKATHLGKTACSTNIASANLPPIRS